MTREVDLVSYLPMFMQEYKEMNVTLEAENPEFVLVWKAADRTLRNEFIATADEAGISRFEGILGITPLKDETLELRRNRVQDLWFNRTPLTFRVFIERLAALCGSSDFTVTKHFLSYRIDITTNLEQQGLAEELDKLLELMIPCNMVIISNNRLSCRADSSAYVAGCVCSVEHFMVSSLEPQIEIKVSNCAYFAGGIRCEEHFVISSKEE